MNAPFVKRAPEIAEEILAKVASLPAGLQTFSQDLLTKTAAPAEEKLVYPGRLSLEDLRKAAAGRGVDLPKVAAVPTADAEKVAGDLRALAKRAAAAAAEDIALTAAAIVAEGQEKAAMRVQPRPRTRVPRPAPVGRATSVLAAQPHNPFKRLFSEKSRREHELWRAKANEQMGKVEGTPQHTQRMGEKALADEARHREDASKRRTDFAEKAISAAPAMGLAVGVPLAAAAALKPGPREKREEVKIYK